mmetsp:Transcript_21674/g.67298  ORF Transcript_21674/g.67298 Transcript_21674/m.67298 type:complete len:676 (-) Transcript_21674:151-2178(-)
MARAFSLTATALAVLLLFAQVAVATDDVGNNEAAAAQEHAQRAVSAVFDPAVHHTLGRHVARGFTAQQASVRSVAANASCTSSAMQASSYMAAVNASCGADVRASLELFFMFNVSTPAARAAVDTMCSASCQAAYKAFVDAYAPCGNDGAARGLKAVTTMCQRWGGDYCAYKLRAIADLDCVATTEVACTTNSFCQWTGANCTSSNSAAVLEQVCTPCYEAFISVMQDVPAGHGAYTGVFQNIRAAGIPVAPGPSHVPPVFVRLQHGLVCSKVRNTFCFPIFANLDWRLYKLLNPINTLPIEDIPGILSNTCTDVGAACLRRTAQAFDTVMSASANIELRQCLSRAHWSAATTECYSNYKSTVALGKSAAAQYTAVCSRGAGPSQNDWCMPAMHRWSRLSCYSCNTTCYTLATTLATDMGCCANHLDRMQSTRVFPSDFPPEYRAGVSFSYAERYNTSHNVTLQQLGFFPGCPSFYNASEVASIVAAGRAACPRAPAVSRELPLRGLRWSAVSGNATRRAALTAALRTDVALAAGVLVDDVVDAALAEDASQALTVASRRQAVAGTKFTFGIRADTTAAASLAASEFDTAATNGNLRVDSAAAVLAEGCTGCVGSPTAAPGETPAPPPTGPNAFSNVAGASPGSGNSGSAESPAANRVVLTTAAVAALLAFVMAL